MKISLTVFNLQSRHKYKVQCRNGYVQCSKGNNSIRRQTRVTVHLFCSHSVLHWCGFVKISQTVSVMEQTRKNALTDGGSLKILVGIT